MSVRVYRVQDADGRGPFKPGFTQQWADHDFAPGMVALPTWMQEFGADLLTRKGHAHEHFGSAVRKREYLAKWFSPMEQVRLTVLGFEPVMLIADRVLAESDNQLVFARRRPLAEKAVRCGWPQP